MNGFEEIDWEVAADFLKRFGGILIAVLWALAARRKKKASNARNLDRELPENLSSPEVPAIEPGTDATKLSSQYSQQDKVLPGSVSGGEW